MAADNCVDAVDTHLQIHQKVLGVMEDKLHKEHFEKIEASPLDLCSRGHDNVASQRAKNHLIERMVS